MSSAITSASASATGSGLPTLPSSFKTVGIVLAVASGVLIGASFVFKKKGLLRSQGGHELGEGVGYLKSPLWWLGMTLMILGEFCNFAAYAFVEAIVVTPLGALSVVISAVLSSIFLKESLTFFGWVGCGLCIVGSIIIALNAPQEGSIGNIREFQKLFFAPGFLALGGALIAGALVIIFFVLPKYGKKTMLWCIMVCSMIGGLSVSTTTGLGSAIVMSIFQHKNQFNYWFPFFLIGFVTVTLITEVYYLNIALARFNTAMVTPTYYVIFTFFTLVTTVVLFQGLKASVTQILTIVMAFLVICAGITILQMSKVDPAHFSKLDRRSTILLQAARNATERGEKLVTGVEDPGIDTLRGSFGTIGSIIRARSTHRMSQSSRGANATARRGLHGPSNLSTSTDGQIQRHQLYDAPMPVRVESSVGSDVGDRISLQGAPPRTSTIKFGDQDVAHYYHGTGAPAGARHEMLPSHGPPRQQGSQIQRQPIPLAIHIDPMPMSAPPSDRSFHPSPMRPVSESPAIATGAGYPDVAYGDEPLRNVHRFPSPKRGYPRGPNDREERVSLVQEDPHELENGTPDSESEAELLQRGGIRLLQSSSSRI